MGGYKIRGPDGYGLRGPDGYAVRQGVTPGLPCEHCSDTTPSVMLATFSGIQLCTGCHFSINPFNHWAEYTQESGESPNRSYLLTQFSFCEWRFLDPNHDIVIGRQRYLDDGCSIPLSLVLFNLTFVQLFRLNRAWRLIYDPAGFRVFDSTTFTNQECLVPRTFPAGGLTCPPSPITTFPWSGTIAATIEVP